MTVRDNTLTLEDKSIEDVLKSAGGFYARAEYRKAIEVLESGRDQVDPGIWHYNLGTVFAKIENFPLARYHFLKAEWIGNHSVELQRNKALVEEKLETQKYEKLHGFLDYAVYGGDLLAQGPLITVTLLFFVGSLWQLFKKRVIGFGVSSVCALIFLGSHFWIRSWDRSIVLEKQYLLEGPSGIFTAREEIPVGVLIVSKQKGGWRKVIFPSRFSGWIKNSGLKELE